LEITSLVQNPPSISDLEISILGGGKSYGESLVLHLGNNKWGIIDNCNNQKTKQPLALEYLDKLKVSYENVLFIICTHWHQDHTTNITKLFSECSNAELYISHALNCKEFEHYICMKSNIRSNFNAAGEFRKLIEIEDLLVFLKTSFFIKVILKVMLLNYLLYHQTKQPKSTSKNLWGISFQTL